MVAQDEERLGWQEMEQGQLENAEVHFRRALELDPYRADALNGLGQVYLSWGDFEQAQELFQMAIAQAQEDLPHHQRHTSWEDVNIRPYLRGLYHLAVTLFRQGLWDEACEPLEELVAWDTEAIGQDGYYLLGMLQLRANRPTEAVECFQQSLSRYPEAFYSVGLAHFLQGQLTDARQAWANALAVIPDLSLFITNYPALLPFPLWQSDDETFVRTSRYVDDMVDLWTPEAKEELGRCMKA